MFVSRAKHFSDPGSPLLLPPGSVLTAEHRRVLAFILMEWHLQKAL